MGPLLSRSVVYGAYTRPSPAVSRLQMDPLVRRPSRHQGRPFQMAWLPLPPITRANRYALAGRLLSVASRR